MPRRLKSLVIDEVSSVDRGAGEGVRILLTKRDGEAKIPDIDAALAALRKGLSDIDADAEVTDKDTAKADLRKEFVDHITEITGYQEPAMTPEQLQKAIDDAVTKATAPIKKQLGDTTAALAKAQFEKEFAALPADQQAFCKAMSDEDKKKFMAKKPEERQAECDEAKKSALDKLDPAIRKRLDQADENDKILKGLLEQQEVAKFAKKADDLGIPGHGETIRKAYAGDATAQGKLDELLKGMSEQIRTGKVFAEFGDNRGKDGATAFDQLTAKAAELQKSDPKLTKEQAFDKVYNDPANAALREQHKTEETKKRAA